MAEERAQRRLAAILAADVVGYSRMMGADEIGTLVALSAVRSEFVDPLIARHGGRIVKSMGDGLLLEFPSVVNATQCSIELQQGMGTRNGDVPEDQRITFRIGVNLGDIVVQGDDIFGDGVNVAARLEGLAEPGGVLVSQTVHENIAGKLDAKFVDNGERALKNIAKPIRVWSWPDRLSDASHGRAAKPLVLVAEFEGRREEEKELAHGMRDDLMTALARLTGLEVTVDRD